MFTIIAFWAIVGILVWVYFGYPLSLGIVSPTRKPPDSEDTEPYANVSFIIAAYNDEKVIGEKIENRFESAFSKVENDRADETLKTCLMELTCIPKAVGSEV